jgi:glycosyltransferase involved in cell wall biosynthesis
MNSIIIPAYNEEKSIVDVVTKVHSVMRRLSVATNFEVIVIDDGSTDQTMMLLTELQSSFPELRILQNNVQMGVGASRSRGVRHARGDKIAFIDADMTYSADDLPKIFEGLKTYDMVIGARKEEKGSLRYLRALIKNMFKGFASFLTHTKIPDLNSGIRGMDKAKVMEFLYLLPKGHSWVSTTTLCFLASGYSVSFIPAEYFVREGKSSFKIVRDSYAMFMTILKTIVYFYPLRIILPISYACILGSIVFLIRDIYQSDIADTTIVLLLTGIIIFVFALISEQMACLRREINQKIDRT